MLNLRPVQAYSPILSQRPGCVDAVGLRGRGDRPTLLAGHLLGAGDVRDPDNPSPGHEPGHTGSPLALDTGSVVTLLRPDLAGGMEGGPMEVVCINGDTRIYGTCHVVVRTPYTRAGIVPQLPVPLLIGRDCPIFHRLWNPERGSWARREPPR